MRPVSVLPNGDFSTDDLNDLYRGLAQTNDQLLNPEVDEIPPEMEGGKNHLQRELYDGLKALTLTGSTQYQNRHKKGIAEMIGGSGSPKHGFFQNKMIGKRQDLSMRGVIVPEPTLSVDEVGVPEAAAKELYKPFVQRRLVRSGNTPRQAEDSILAGDLSAVSALKAEMEDRPLLLKRDPVLHKYGIQAYKPRLVRGSAVKIHPLATAGYNADFDGDKMSAFLPVSSEAVKEAFNMLPSRTLFTPSTGRLMLKPEQESMLGLYDLSRFGKRTNKRFRNVDELAREVSKGNVHYTDVVTLDDATVTSSVKTPSVSLDKIAAEKPVRTTIGRLLLNSALPEKMQHKEVLTDSEFRLTKGKLEEVLTHVARNSTPAEFSDSVDKLKDIGYEHSTGFSFSLEDLLADTEVRDRELAKARIKEKAIRAKTSNKAERDQKLVDLYQKAGKTILVAGKKKADASGNRMYDWVRSGAKGNWGQYHQMTISPLQVVDSGGKPLPVPIEKSYSEGLDSGSYYAAMFGARMGTIGRQMSTADPGALSKQMMQVSMGTMISKEDCGTNKGIQASIEDPTTLDRYLAKDVSLGVRGGRSKGQIPKGTLVTPAVISRLRNNKVKDIPVRSPLKCEEERGLCSVCFGLNEEGHTHQKGVNIGVIATQALGEPMTQMAMNAFHTGGVVGAKGSTAKTEFQRVSELMTFPRRLPGSAILATASGKVDKVVQDKATGGHRVYVGETEHFVPALKGKPTLSTGRAVKKGDSLSAGPKNPHELLDLTNMATTQRYITDELAAIYPAGSSTLHRRNTEVMVRNLTNLSQVDDPGDKEGVLPMDKMTTTQIEAYNKQLGPGQKPIKHTEILKSIAILPNEMQTDWMARLQARDLKRTVLDAAAEGWSSDIHGVHPIPGMAYGREFGKGTPLSPFKY
jgi:DNA-directed RNA polymerase subunit beta'